MSEQRELDKFRAEEEMRRRLAHHESRSREQGGYECYGTCCKPITTALQAAEQKIAELEAKITELRCAANEADDTRLIPVELTRFEIEALLPPYARTLLWAGSHGWPRHRRSAQDKLAAAVEAHSGEKR